MPTCSLLPAEIQVHSPRTQVSAWLLSCSHSRPGSSSDAWGWRRGGGKAFGHWSLRKLSGIRVSVTGAFVGEGRDTVFYFKAGNDLCQACALSCMWLGLGLMSNTSWGSTGELRLPHTFSGLHSVFCLPKAGRVQSSRLIFLSFSAESWV